jgi:lipopolysaccharide/colanic/teichoic acid biosynthesis glycosyltransferase
MTLVGPRPTNTVNSENLKKIGDFTRERMRCGITGPFQAHKGEGLNQRKLDEEYIDFVATHSGRHVLLKDLALLGKTVTLIFKAQGL